MMSSKTQNYRICEILYNIYEDHIFQIKKEIKFVSSTAVSFMNDTANFVHFLDLIDAKVKPDYIATLKKQLDKAELKHVCY